VWVQTGATSIALPEALAKCDYDTAVAATALRTRFSPSSTLGALERRVHQDELMPKCMLVLGWRQLTPP
jgi:hypothetical protein